MGPRDAGGRSISVCRIPGLIPVKRQMTSPSNDRSTQTLSVIVPFFNERATVREIVERVLAVDIAHTAKQIILVDDGSTDGSGEIAAQLADDHPASVQLLRLPANAGKGAAVRQALSVATGELVVIQDADLEYDPQDLVQIVAAFDDPAVNAVYGSRRRESTHAQGQAVFRWGGCFLTGLTNILFGSALTDQPTGYKCVRRSLLERLDLSATGFEICAELTAKLLRRQERIVEVPVRYAPRSINAGKKIRPSDGVRIAWTLLRLRIKAVAPLSKTSGPRKPSLFQYPRAKRPCVGRIRFSYPDCWC